MIEGDRAARLAPLLIGTLSHAPLAYRETRRRWFDWPAPVATEPTRTWGPLATTSIDRSGEAWTVVHDLTWRGHKSVDGSREVVFAPDGRATHARIHVRERRWDGCVFERTGEATLDPVGRPLSERWRTDGRCGLRRWTHVWRLDWSGWRACDDQPVSR